MKKAEMQKMGVLELHEEVERLNEELFAIQQEKDELLAKALSLHEERVPFEEELDARARTMGQTVPRMVLNAREAAKAEHGNAPDTGE
jgi:hypothetical protein